MSSSFWNSGKVPRTKVKVETRTTPSDTQANIWNDSISAEKLASNVYITVLKKYQWMGIDKILENSISCFNFNTTAILTLFLKYSYFPETCRLTWKTFKKLSVWKQPLILDLSTSFYRSLPRAAEKSFGRIKVGQFLDLLLMGRVIMLLF